MNDAFFCITLGTFILSWWWKNRAKSADPAKKKAPPTRITVTNDIVDPSIKEKTEAEKKQKEIDRQRERDVAELRKQGYTDELIATILPIVKND